MSNGDEFETGDLSPSVWSAVTQHIAPLVPLVRFEFVSDTRQVWAGFGQLRTLDGTLWDGVGVLGRIDTLASSLSGSAPVGRLSVSGVDPRLIEIAQGEAGEFMNRPVHILLQAFAGRVIDGDPMPLGFGLMKQLEVSRSIEAAVIAVTYEWAYGRRGSPPGGFYSDRDQQLRFAGDLGCERIPNLRHKRSTWPKYPAT